MIGALLAALLALPVAPPPANVDWDYQLGGAVAPAANVGVVTRDRTAAPAAGAYGVCYVNAFQTQGSERRFWRRHHWNLVLQDHGRAVVDENWASLDGRRLGFDFAVSEQCGQYDECGAYLAHYGDEVVDVEYTDAGFAKARAALGSRISVERRDLDLTPGGVRRWC